MSSAEERRQVVEAIETCDRSIERIRGELARLRGLRASLAARMDTWGMQPPPEPAVAAASYSDGEIAAQSWLAELENTGRSPELPLAPETQTQAMPFVSSRPPRRVELRQIAALVIEDRRYERVLLAGGDLPNGRVWIYQTEYLKEAHLGPNSTQFVGQAYCGFYAQRSKWWRAEPESQQVELCLFCAQQIPGAVLT